MTDAERIAKFNEVVNAVKVLVEFDQAWIAEVFTIGKDGQVGYGNLLSHGGMDRHDANEAADELSAMIGNGEIKTNIPKGEHGKVWMFASFRYNQNDAYTSDWYEVDKAHVIKSEIVEEVPF